ncbi:MAG: nucleotidyltransferase [endosymbiont of Galathealinum brachiosum]|uniref:Nucleotidyltransferase n=1 Tax=endosymbiont of Galathealinum brachiosum TaxID=2200906 RepID=A0A370DHX5_9GAMM|nr:MAG: nucleotidyltransferase [endosymbiont of Galathealinum brachiosum]
MINVLIPMAGSITYDGNQYAYPKPLTEVKGQPMIQGVLEDLNAINKSINYIFAVNEADCKQYHIDNVLQLLTNNSVEIIRVVGDTAGSACTALLAIDSINNDTPLIISNMDQKFDCDLSEYIDAFKQRDLDAATICFNSVHPRWSYALTNDDGQVIETSEKRPISHNAIAGLFYFKHGKDFVKAAMQSIYKDASVNGSYYIAPVLNEMILDGKKLGISLVENDKYHTFYSPQLLEEYNRIS